MDMASGMYNFSKIGKKGMNANYRMRPLFWSKSVTKNKRTCQNADHSAMDGRRVVSSNGSGSAKAIRAVRMQVLNVCS
jgi:hypothetical protein